MKKSGMDGIVGRYGNRDFGQIGNQKIAVDIKNFTAFAGELDFGGIFCRSFRFKFFVALDLNVICAPDETPQYRYP